MEKRDGDGGEKDEVDLKKSNVTNNDSNVDSCDDDRWEEEEEERWCGG